MQKLSKLTAWLLILALVLQSAPVPAAAAVWDPPRTDIVESTPRSPEEPTLPPEEPKLPLEQPESPGVPAPKPGLILQAEPALLQKPAVQTMAEAEDLAWTVADGVLTISGNGALPDWTPLTDAPGSTAPWSGELEQVTSVVVEEGITHLGSYAFRSFTALTDVSLPQSLTSIGMSAFSTCTALTAIELPAGLTELGPGAFIRCSALTSIELPDGLTSLGAQAFAMCTGLNDVQIPEGITALPEYLFYGCSALTAIDLPEGMTALPEYLFYGCTALTDIALPDGLTAIGFGAFQSCEALAAIELPDGLTSLGGQAFALCTGLTAVRIPEGITALAENLFYGCTALTDIDLPEGLTAIGEGAFRGCASLTEITLPEGLTDLGNSAFYECTSLASIRLPAGVTAIGEWTFGACGALAGVSLPEGLTSIGFGAFQGCTALTAIELPAGLKTLDRQVFSDCSSLTAIVIPEGITALSDNLFYGCYALADVRLPAGLKTIGEQTFCLCGSLAGIDIPQTLTKIGKSAFYGCTGLTEIAIRGSLKTLDEQAFYGCSALERVELEGKSASVGDYCFQNCTALKEFVFADGLRRIGGYAFEGCENLARVALQCSEADIGSHCFESCTALTELDLSGVAIIGYQAFKGCTGLTELLIPDALTYLSEDAFYGCTALERVEIHGEAATFSRECFYQCSSLTEVVLSGIEELGYYAFGECTLLTRVTLPDDLFRLKGATFYRCKALQQIELPSQLTELGYGVFQECLSLTQISIPDGIAAIGDSAFASCHALESVRLPANLETIGSHAFDGCKSLPVIDLPATVTSIGEYALSGCVLLTEIEFPDGLTELGERALSNCEGLTYVEIPDSVTELGSSVFSDCDNLIGAKLPAGITGIYDLFHNCKAFTGCEIPDTVKYLGDGTFYGCISLTGIELPDSLVRIGSQAFYRCTALTQIDIPDGVTEIEKYAFYGCTALTGIKLPAQLTTLGQYAFQGCTALTGVKIPDGVRTIGRETFAGCTALAQVDFPESLTRIDREAFTDCSSLTAAYIPDGVTYIGYSAFYQCTAMTEVDLPDDLLTIDTYAFCRCRALREVVIPVGVTALPEGAFYACNAMTRAVIPLSVTSIVGGNFGVSPDLTIYGYAGSYAQEYADAAGIPFEIYEEPVLPQVTMSVTDENGNAISSGYTVKWYRSGKLLGTGELLQAERAGGGYSCCVVLDDSLLQRYVQPEILRFQVGEEDLALSCDLRELSRVTVTGKFLDSDGEPVPGTVRIEQTYSDTLTQTVTASAGADGSFSCEAAAVHSVIVCQAEGFRDLSMGLPLSGAEEVYGVGELHLSRLPESKVTLTLLRQDAVRPDGEAVKTTLDNFDGLTFTVENVTQGTVITDFAVQYPYLIFGEGQVAGKDTLRISAADAGKGIAFEAVNLRLDGQGSGSGKLTCIQRGSFVIDQIGSKPQNRILIFDAEGTRLVSELTREGYRSAELPAGDYQAVLLEVSELLSDVPSLSILEGYGLEEGTDYLKLEVPVRDGVITVIDRAEVPELDERRLYYTEEEKTSVTLNTSAAYAGKYVLLRVGYKLQKNYDTANQVVAIELPEGIKAPDHGLTVDNRVVPFTIQDNTILVQVDKPEAVIRLYLLGADVGTFRIRADLLFGLDGRTVRQPLGAQELTLRVADFTVPETVGTDAVTVFGTAIPNSVIEVYDGDQKVGKTRSNAAGSWSTEITVENTLSYQRHDVRIHATNEDVGKTLISEPEIMIYDADTIEVLKVDMYCGWVRTEFDFRNPVAKKAYPWVGGNFTFTVELNRNDDPRIDKVYVVTMDYTGRTTYVKCQYDSTKNRWVGAYNYGTPSKAPRGLDVQILRKAQMEATFDEDLMKEVQQKYQELADQYDREREEQKQQAIENTVLPDFEAMPLEELNTTVENYAKDMADLLKETSDLLKSHVEGAGIRVEQKGDTTVMDMGSRQVITKTRKRENVNEAQLREEGYTSFLLPDDRRVYVLEDDNSVRIVDPTSAEEVTTTIVGDVLDSMATKNQIDAMAVDAVNSYIGDRAVLLNRLNRLDELNHSYKESLGFLEKRVYHLMVNDPKNYRDLAACEDLYEDLLGRYTMSNYEYVKLDQHIKNCEVRFGREGAAILENTGRVLDGVSLGFSVYSMVQTNGKTKDLEAIYNSISKTCSDNSRYQSLKNEVRTVNNSMKTVSAMSIVIDGVSLVGGLVAGAASFGAGTVVTSLVLGGVSYGVQEFADRTLGKEYDRIATELKALDCDGDGIPDYLEYLQEMGMMMEVVVDPSGYVYEAVPSNRLEGVRAEIYYLDENGADVLWNAEDYDQINPQYTDADGRYQWDVPFGLWLVKYSKEGYLDADSRDDPAATENGYLPVPPPQLDVNVGMISTASPEVEDLNVYQDQVQIIFSQYMKPDALRLSVVSGGETIYGRLKPVNAEFNEELTEQFATVFNFIPDRELSGTATVTVTDAVNYAGTAMEGVYARTKAVTIRPRTLDMAKEATCAYGGTLELTVRILPAEAGANRNLTVTTAAPGLLDVAQQTVTTDENGAAVITLIGTLPTSAELTVGLEGTDLQNTALIHVEMSDPGVCSRVTASIPSGSTVAPGTLLELYTATEGAEIYYTLDGTCPCVEDSASRIRYDGPIALEADTFLIAYAVKEGLADSATAGFMYTVKEICIHENTAITGSVEAACTTDGYTGDLVCEDCGAVLEEGAVIPAVGHRWDEGVVAVEPTEEQEGEMRFTCRSCGATRTEVIPALGHAHSYEAVVTAPTCTEQGFTTHTCRCGDSYVDSYTEALGHAMGQWYTVREAACTTDGLERRECSRCGHSEERTIEAAGHDYESVVTEPTCTERGFTTHTCAACGDSYVDSYTEALGHSFGGWTAAGNGMEERKCERCGFTEQRPAGGPENPFTDVPEGSFYYEPVLWAVENGITNGTTPTTFGPNDQCMRAQVVTFLWRAAGSPEPTKTDNPFVDMKPADFYYKAVLWAVENGVTNGLDATHFGPFAYCNRAQVVTFLYRSLGSPDVESANNPFTDVPEGQWFTAPVLWAVENGVTNGLSATAFGPTAICNRAQIVTFLYRAFAK